MLEITNLRDGAILDCTHGFEHDNMLEIPVQGIAPANEVVTVNAIPAERCDRNFSAVVKLTARVNQIEVRSSGYYGERTLTITVLWDKSSFKRYNFFFDDCCFFLRWIALNRPKSIFDEMFLKRLRRIHELYQTKFTLNLFYHDDHHDFSIADFPADYKSEFQSASDWLRLSFHAKSEFPDRPYQNASAEVLANDFDLIYREVCRFAGAESFIPPVVIHWAITHPDNFPVLKERNVRCLTGGYLNAKTSLTEEHHSAVTDIGYHYEKDTAIYLSHKRRLYDRFNDLILHNNLLCCNYDDIESITQRFAELEQNPSQTLSLMSHEQYSYADYMNYIPDHLDRVEHACKLASENGYEPIWFNHGLLGNDAWEK